MLVLGTDTTAVNMILFTGTRNHLKRAFALPLMLLPTSRHYGSPSAYTLGQTDKSAQNIPMRQTHAQKLQWCRNINLLPIRWLRLRDTLGPTNSRLMNVVEKPGPLRRSGFSPLFAATPTRILIWTRSTRLHSRASARARRPPTRSPLGAPRYRWLA